jgi:hypothetical protein
MILKLNFPTEIAVAKARVRGQRREPRERAAGEGVRAEDARSGVMERVPVESSNVRSIGYYEPSRTMHVEFRDGRVYEYSGVPPEAHQALVNAPSVGRHFHAHIKSRFPARRL